MKVFVPKGIRILLKLLAEKGKNTRTLILDILKGMKERGSG